MRIQFSHDGRLACVIVKQGLASATSNCDALRSEVHLWAVSEWPAGRTGSQLESPSVSSRTSGTRFKDSSDTTSENGSESSETVFTVSTEPPSLVLKHEDGFHSASFRQGPTGKLVTAYLGRALPKKKFNCLCWQGSCSADLSPR